ncbi:hypothetical protein [Kocuria aegyptia]|uniref:Uncharacterized protein n=1 Tax=Kocuria aegyptia TaxID=330943 RepID=A0ABN2KA55_9MICC
MTFSASGALAVELHRHSSSHWIATYYPMVLTPVGRWADVTWVLHRCLIPPTTVDRPEPARWLEARSADPGHFCYANHQVWREALADGYVTARAALDIEDIEEPLSVRDGQRLREHTVVVPAGQLSEWMLDDLQDEASDLPG